MNVPRVRRLPYRPIRKPVVLEDEENPGVWTVLEAYGRAQFYDPREPTIAW